MSTVPSLSQNFEGVEGKEAEIRDLETKLAQLKLDYRQQQQAIQTMSSPLPKPVAPHKPTPSPTMVMRIDTPEKCVTSGEVTTSPDGSMAAESPYFTALAHIKNLPDGELKTAMMALCEASMVSPQVWSTNHSHTTWISRLTDLYFFLVHLKKSKKR